MRKGQFGKWLLPLLVLVSLFLLAGCGGSKPATPPETKATAETTEVKAVSAVEAKKIFNGKCEGCHGPTRAGATGPALLPETHSQVDSKVIAFTITKGRSGTAMPSFGDQLKEEEINGLVKLIKEVPPDQPPVWGIEEIEKTRRVVETKDLPKQPKHNYNINNLFFVVEREVSKGAFVDGDTFKVIKEEPFGFAIHEIEYSPDGRFGYTVARNGQVVKFDLYTLEKVAEVRSGLNARGVAVSNDGKYVLVGNYLPFNMVILSADNLKPIKIIDAKGQDPDGKEVSSRVAAVADARKHGVFLAALKEAGQVWAIDYTKPDFPITKIEKVGKILHDFFFDQSGRYWMGAAQLSNATVIIDAQEKKLVASMPTGGKPHPGIGANWTLKDGRQVAGTVHIGEGKLSVWEVGTWKVIGDVKLDGPGLFLKTHPKSQYVWTDVFAGDNRDVIHVHEKEPPFKIVKTLKPSPGKTSIHPEFTDDGKYVLISIWDKEGEIVVYDAETLEEKTRIKGLVTPTGKFNVGNRVHERY